MVLCIRTARSSTVCTPALDRSRTTIRGLGAHEKHYRTPGVRHVPFPHKPMRSRSRWEPRTANPRHPDMNVVRAIRRSHMCLKSVLWRFYTGGVDIHASTSSELTWGTIRSAQRLEWLHQSNSGAVYQLNVTARQIHSRIGQNPKSPGHLVLV